MSETRPHPPEEARLKLVRDATLLRQVSAGDRAAKVELVRQLWPRVHGMARHMSPYPDEVEDLAQEAMLQILGAAPRFLAEGCVEAWADTIAVRTILRKLRRMHLLRRIFPLGASPPAEAERLEAAPDVESEAMQRATARKLTDLLHRLPPDQRLALVLKVVRGHTLDEVATMMNRSGPSVRYLLRKGRARLGELAAKDGVARELFAGRES